MFASMNGLMIPAAIGKETERSLAPTAFKKETLLLPYRHCNFLIYWSVGTRWL
jgi:hypothetical protein